MIVLKAFDDPRTGPAIMNDVSDDGVCGGDFDADSDRHYVDASNDDHDGDFDDDFDATFSAAFCSAAGDF